MVIYGIQLSMNAAVSGCRPSALSVAVRPFLSFCIHSITMKSDVNIMIMNVTYKIIKFIVVCAQRFAILLLIMVECMLNSGMIW